MAQTPEGRVKAAVKRWLDERGAYYYMPVPTGYSRAGVPDFLVCLPVEPHGHFVGIETKAPGKTRNTTPNQKRELAWIDRAKGTALVIDNVRHLDDALGDYFHDRSTEGAETHPETA